jgi:TetR/AcrR family transcriptional regulator, mexCD-oprJ operon repressor
MQQAILALVRQGQRQGRLRSDLPPELLPQAIAGTLRITLRFARSRNAAAEDIGAQVADLLLHGFARPAEDPAR